LSQLLAQGAVDVNCRKNVVRALRLLCSVRECLEELKQNDGIPVLLECLKSENAELALGALQAVEVVSWEGDPEVLQWLCNKEIMQCVVRYCNHSKQRVKQRAMRVLLNSAQILEGRMALSSAAGVETMVAFMESAEKTSSIFHKVVCALCTCCRDVISRQRLRDCGGLERFITMLADHTHSALHGNMMAALVCYYFDETTLKLMVTKMGLIHTLCYHLKAITMEQHAIAERENGGSTLPLSPEATQQKDSEIEMMESSEDEQPAPSPSKCPDVLPDKQQQLLPSTTTGLRKRPNTEQSPSDRPPLSKRPHLADDARAESTGAQSKTESITAELTRTESTMAESTEAESTRAESTMAESTEAELTRAESTMAESTEAESTRAEAELWAGSARATPTSFLDSLLSSPNPYQSKSSSFHPPVSPLVGDVHSTFEAQAIMMISRMSHMRDCIVTLSYPDTLLTLLDYLVSSTPPNTHISKVLNRIFMNPHCFQNCITGLVPSKLQQLICRSDPPPPASSVTASKQPCADLHQVCKGLMGHIAKNAESPYGQGVLAHMLLRGSEKEKRASCLSMPLLCRCDL
jgi:hypothetical protein